MAQYLVQRRSLCGVVLMVDSRLGLTELDLRLLQLIAPRLSGAELRLLVLLTKADKLSRSAAAQALAGVQQVLAQHCPGQADLGVSLFSALKSTGVDEAAMLLHGWATGSRQLV
jgi:GTP-binding protein